MTPEDREEADSLRSLTIDEQRAHIEFVLGIARSKWATSKEKTQALARARALAKLLGCWEEASKP